MARALRVSLVAFALAGGCFRESSPGEARALAVWHELDRVEASRARAAATGSSSSGEMVLGAEQAFALAAAASLDVAIEGAEADVDAAGVMAARQLENPELRLTNFRPGGLEGGRSNVDIAVRVPIPRPWNLHANARAARLAADASRTEVDEALRRLRARVLKLFARLAQLRGDQALVEQVVKLQAKRRTIVKSRVDRALATLLDLQLVDVSHQQRAAEIARIIDRVAAIEGELRRLCAAGPQVRFQIDVDALSRIEAPRDRIAATEQALTRRPDVRAAASRVGGAEAGAYVARGSAWPWFSWAQLGHTLPGSLGAWGFGVTLEVPLLSWKRGQIKRADAQVRLRRLEEQAAVRDVVHEIDEALERVATTAAYARRIEAGLVAELDAAVQLAARASDGGALDPLRVVEVEIERVEARRRHLAALLEHREAVIDLEAAMATR